MPRSYIAWEELRGGGQVSELPYISLFSGAGGLDIGLNKAGFRLSLAVDIDPVRCETLRSNKPEWKVIQADVAELTGEELLGEADLLKDEVALISGGPPCQPFSKSSIRRGRNPLADPRSSLVMEFARIVKEIRPLSVIFENVPGLAGRKGRPLFQGLISTLEPHYRLTWGVLNAVNYGVPQKRRRLFLLGIRRDLDAKPELPRPTHSSKSGEGLFPYVTAGEAIGDLDDGVVREDEVPRGRYGELLKLIPPGGNYLWLTEKYTEKPIFKYRSKFWSFLLKLHPDLPSWTIQARPGAYVGPFHWRGRRLRIPEVKRLQTFPDDWKLSGSRRKQWEQLGDAVPPLLASKIGESLISSLKPVLGEVLETPLILD